MPWLGPLLRISHSCNQGIGQAVLLAGRIHFLVLVGLMALAFLAVSWSQRPFTVPIHSSQHGCVPLQGRQERARAV